MKETIEGTSSISCLSSNTPDMESTALGSFEKMDRRDKLISSMTELIIEYLGTELEFKKSIFDRLKFLQKKEEMLFYLMVVNTGLAVILIMSVWWR